MINLDDEVTLKYLAKSCGELANLKDDPRAIRNGGAQINQEAANRVLQAVHSVREAGFFDLVTIGELAGQLERALMLIGTHEMAPMRHRTRVLLRGAAKLQELIEKADKSNQVDIAELMADLERLLADRRPAAPGQDRVSAAPQERPSYRPLRMLLVEDDIASRLVLETFLGRHGECHVAVNGREAVEMFRAAFEQGQTYDLICMDIMMPELDGREAVRQIRAMEREHGVNSSQGSKIIMTTAVDDLKEVSRCFQQLCDSYLIKPIDLMKLSNQMRSYRLIE